MKRFFLVSLLILGVSPVFGQLRVFFSTNQTACGAGYSLWHCNASWVESVDLYYGTPEDFDPEAWLATHATRTPNAFPGILKFSSDNIRGNTGTGEIYNSRNSPNTPHIVVIRSGHTVTLDTYIKYSGHIIVDAGASLVFNKLNSQMGRLEMTYPNYFIQKTIELRYRDGFDPAKIKTSGNGNASTFLRVGNTAQNFEQINGHFINAIPSPIKASNGTIVNIPINEELLKCLGDYSPNQVDWTEKNIVDLLTCANPNFTLPVDLVSLNAKAVGSEVEMKWVVANEIDFSHYVVEWSLDGKDYVPAGTVSAKGTQYGKQSYSFRHQPGHGGTLYYRLLAVDIDGTVEQKGKVQMIKMGAEEFSVHAQQGKLFIKYNGPSESQVAVIDPMGRVLFLSSLETIGTQQFRPGLYLVQLSNVLEKKVQRVVIR